MDIARVILAAIHPTTRLPLLDGQPRQSRGGGESGVDGPRIQRFREADYEQRLPDARDACPIEDGILGNEPSPLRDRLRGEESLPRLHGQPFDLGGDLGMNLGD